MVNYATGEEKLSASFDILAGASMSGKTYKLCMDVLKDAYEHPEKKYIIVIPDQAGNAYEKKLIEMNNELYGRPGFMNIDVLGFNRLAFRIFENMGVRDTSVLEEYEKSMLIRVALGELSGELEMFKGSIDKPGFIKEMKSLISEFIQYDIGVEDIDKLTGSSSEQAIKMNPALKVKLKDVRKVYGKFLELLEQRESGLSEERLKKLSRLLSSSEKCQVTDGVVFCFDEYRGYTPDQLRVISELSKRAERLRFAICIEPYIIRNNVDLKDHDIFYQSLNTIRKLQEVIGMKPRMVYMERGKNRPAMLSFLEENMFRFPVKEYGCDEENVNAENASVRVDVYADAETEVRVIAQDIRRLVRSGFRYKDITVATGDIENFDKIAESIFGQYEIPYFTDYSRKLRKNPYTEAIIKVLDIIDRDYDYSSVFGLLKTGTMDVDAYAADALENYILRTGIRGNKLWNKQILCRKDKASEELLESYRKMNEVRLGVVTAMKPFDGLEKKSHKVVDYITALRDFLEKNSFEQKIKESSGFLEDRGRYTDARAMNSLWGVLTRLLDETEDFLGNTEMSLHDFSVLLQSGINEISIGVIPPTLDAVILADPLRSRILETKVLYFANVCDGIVPPASGSGGIISDKDKVVIDDLFNEMKTGKHLADHGVEKKSSNLFILYQMMSKPSHYLRISYPCADINGTALEPSYIVGRIMRLFPGMEMHHTEISPLSGTVSSDKLQFISQVREMLDIIHVSEEKKLPDEYKDALENAARYCKYGQGISDDIKRGLNFSNAAGAVSADTLKNINLKLSVSKMEKYMSCPYAYFLQYILGLQDRPEKKIEYYDVGNIMHKALEETARTIKEKYNNDWRGIKDDTLKEIMSEYFEKAWGDYKAEDVSEELDGKTTQVLANMKVLSDRTIIAMRDHLIKGKMLPEYMEQTFNAEFEAVRPDGEKVPVSILGKIDRIDTVTEGEKTYIRIIDYKTGSARFNPQEIKEGTQIQLSLYTHIISNILRDKMKDSEVIPVGMYYYHVDNPVVDGPGPMAIKKRGGDEALATYDELMKALKLDGVSRDEPHVLLRCHDLGLVSEKSGSIIGESTVIPVSVDKEGEYKSSAIVASEKSFDMLGAYSMKKMKEGAEEILAGNFSKNPISYEGKRGNACTYCGYKSVCRFGKTSGSEKSIPRNTDSIRSQIKEFETYAEVE